MRLQGQLVPTVCTSRPLGPACAPVNLLARGRNTRGGGQDAFVRVWRAGDFRLPPGAPEAVAEAQERFEHVANRWAEHVGRIEDAEAAVEAAKAADHEEAVESALAGEELGNVNERENKARAGLEALRRELPALEQAVDEARNEMLPLIDDAAEGWAARLAVEAEEAQARYRAAVEEALGALGEAERSYSAVDFLRAFQPADARMGLAPGCMASRRRS